MARRKNSLSGCIGSVIGVFVFFGLINAMCSKREPAKIAPAPVAYIPTAEDRVAQSRQAASDAKFWAAKNAKDQAEINSYNKANEELRDARADAAQYMQPAYNPQPITREPWGRISTRRTHSSFAPSPFKKNRGNRTNHPRGPRKQKTG